MVSCCRMLHASHGGRGEALGLPHEKTNVDGPSRVNLQVMGLSYVAQSANEF